MTAPNKSRWSEQTDEERAAFRATFVPHAIIETESSRPSQIVACGFAGGARRFRVVSFDSTAPVESWPAVALAAMWDHQRAILGDRPDQTVVPFFGRATGLTVNYTPDLAITYDLDLNEIARHDSARQIGPVRMRFG